VGHVPHLFVPGPWDGPGVALDDRQLHHLRAVLRLTGEIDVTYTDGGGRSGLGRVVGGTLERGEERAVARTRPVTVAVAVPDSKERTRFLVEKAAELGADRIRWLSTRYGQGRPPRADRAQQWADMALEQSRGSHRTIVDDGTARLGDIDGLILVADRGGGRPAGSAQPVTVLIGPEGGWAPGEVPDHLGRIGLGDKVLRVETAVIVALTLLVLG
jgi:16S rRNA (uracil1498-N3)-methyltransferase